MGKHGTKVKRCSHGGCTKFSVTGGVCMKHGAKVQQGRCVAKKTAPNLPRAEESATSMERSASGAATMAVPFFSKQECSASSTGRSASGAATMSTGQILP